MLHGLYEVYSKLYPKLNFTNIGLNHKLVNTKNEK